MIDRIVVENFKSLRRVDLSRGRMNLFVGANASGKSNFLEALRVLQGIGSGFAIGEITECVSALMRRTREGGLTRPGQHPAGQGFVAFDERLRDASHREGFRVLLEAC